MAIFSSPFMSLSSATTGTGATVDFGNPTSDMTAMIIVNGTVTAGVVTLDTSMDGTNWVANNLTTALLTGVNQKIDVTGEAWRFARARVSTTILGGGSVTVQISGVSS